MLFRFEIWLIVLICSEKIFSLTNKDICVKSAGEEDEPCLHKEYSYECDSAKCAVNKEACDHFKSVSFTLRVYKYSNNYHSQKFKTFISQLKKCPTPLSSHASSSVKANDICMNNKCMNGRKRLERLLTMLGILNCPCPANLHVYACTSEATGVCASNKAACDAYTKNQGIKDIESCQD